MPAPRKIKLFRKRVFDRDVSIPQAQRNAGDFRRGSGGRSGRRRTSTGLAGPVVRARPRSLQAEDNASRSTSGPRAPRVSTPRQATPKRRGLLSKVKKSVKKARANLARNRAAKARAKAKKLRGRG